MCKGLSGILTQDNLYWTPSSNSHETIKKTHKLNDRSVENLAPFELHPKGKSVFSLDRNDWKLAWENRPSWFVEPHDADRVFCWLEATMFPEWRANGIEEMRLDSLGYTELPQDMLAIVRKLNCSYNRLTSLKAPVATWLNCRNNRLTKLVAPVATKLYCSYNRLTSLKAPVATWLNCRNNRLTKLVAPVATELYCYNNRLTKLVAPVATKLYCSYNRLTSLKAPVATWLYCSGNRVSEEKLCEMAKK